MFSTQSEALCFLWKPGPLVRICTGYIAHITHCFARSKQIIWDGGWYFYTDPMGRGRGLVLNVKYPRMGKLNLKLSRPIKIRLFRICYGFNFSNPSEPIMLKKVQPKEKILLHRNKAGTQISSLTSEIFLF